MRRPSTTGGNADALGTGTATSAFERPSGKADVLPYVSEITDEFGDPDVQRESGALGIDVHLRGNDTEVYQTAAGFFGPNGNAIPDGLSARAIAEMVYDYLVEDDNPYQRPDVQKLVDEDDGEFAGKSPAYGKMVIALRDAVNRFGGVVTFGDYSGSVSGGLFDSAAAIYGITAQIGIGGKVVARASIDEDGSTILYSGASGIDPVVVEGRPAAPVMNAAGVFAQVEAAFEGAGVEPAAAGEDGDQVELTGNELGDFPDTPEGLKSLRAAALEYLESIRGEMIDCPALGKKVEIRKRGIKEIKKFSANPNKLKLVPGIKKLIRTAFDKSWELNYKKDKKPDVEGYFTLKSRVSIGGEKSVVDLLVEKDSSGLLHYDIIIDRRQTKTALDSSSAVSVAERSPDHKSGHSVDLNLEQVAPDVNQTDEEGRDETLDATEVNVFKPGDKVVDQEGRNHTVMRQDDLRVYVREQSGKWFHPNHLILASGAKPKRVALDGLADALDEDFILDAAGERLTKAYLRGHTGAVFYKETERRKEPRFIPLYNKDGSPFMEDGEHVEVHQGNLFKSQSEADRKNDRIKKAWGLMDDAGEDDGEGEGNALDAVRGGPVYVMNLFIEGVDVDTNGNPIGELAAEIGEEEDLTTEAGIARALQVAVAREVYDKSMENAEKYPDVEVARVRERAIADYQAQTSGAPRDMHAEIAKAIVGKDAVPLIKYFVNGIFAASEGVFERATGVKIRRMAAARKEEALKDWAGWSEERKAEYAAANAQEAAERQAKREEERAARDRANLIAVLGHKKYRRDDDSIISAKDLIEELVSSGYVRLEEGKRGAAKKWTLWNDSTRRGMPLNKNEAEYAQMLLAGIAGSQPAGDAQPAAGVTDKAVVSANMATLRPFLSNIQKAVVSDGLNGEEAKFFAETAASLAETVKTMPRTYGQDGKGDQAVAYLHYFKGSMDWYVTELDKEGDGTEQAFGLADLGQGFPELGYINLREVVQIGAELDFHWKPKTLAAIRGGEGAPEEARQEPKRAWENPENAESDPAGGAQVVETWDSAKADALFSAETNEAEPHADAAHAFISRHLQGRIVKTVKGDCVINSRSAGKLAQGVHRAGGVKFRCIPRVPEVLTQGVADPDMMPINKARSDNIDGFYQFRRTLVWADLKADVRIKVGHRTGGITPLVYDMTANRVALDSTNEEGSTCVPSTSSLGMPGAVCMGSDGANDQILDGAGAEVNDNGDGGLNIEILRAWDNDGNELDPETLEPINTAGRGQSSGGGSKPNDRAFLQSVIDGKADIADPALAGKLEAVYAQYPGDEEMTGLWKRAVNAYTSALMNMASNALTA